MPDPALQTGIAANDVQRLEMIDRFGEYCDDFVFTTDVGFDCDGPATHRFNLVCDVIRSLRVRNIVDDNVSPRCRQSQRDRFTDTGVGASYQ